MPRTNDALALDEAVRDPTSIVWTLVIYDNQLPRAKPCDRDRTCPIACGNQRTDREHPDVVERDPTIVRVVS